MTAPRLHSASAAIALVVTTSACTSISPAGLAAASRLDPLNTPPSEIAVAVGVPDTLRLADGDAVFRIAFRGGSEATPIAMDEAAPLDLSAPGEAGPRPNATDERVYIARIPPADAPRIEAAQAEIRALRADGIKGEGALVIEVVGGCYIGAAPERLAISTWLRTSPTDGFVPLTRRQDIARGIGDAEAALLLATLDPCDTEG